MVTVTAKTTRTIQILDMMRGISRRYPSNLPFPVYLKFTSTILWRPRRVDINTSIRCNVNPGGASRDRCLCGDLSLLVEGEHLFVFGIRTPTSGARRCPQARCISLVVPPVDSVGIFHSPQEMSTAIKEDDTLVPCVGHGQAQGSDLQINWFGQFLLVASVIAKLGGLLAVGGYRPG